MKRDKMNLKTMDAEAIPPRKGFWRLPKKVIGNDLFRIQNALKSMYMNLDAGNDLDMGQLENIIDTLNSVKDQARHFKNGETIKGTEYE